MKEKDYLDPTNDYIFKRMLCESEPALLSMVNAIVQPEQPIRSAVIQNSEVLAPTHEGHSMRLDILATLDNGTRINIEMQSLPRNAFENRLLYYFSNLYSRDFLRGKDYQELRPVYIVAWARESMFKQDPFQNIFELRERRTGRVLAPHCQIHVLQLDKLNEVPSTEQSLLLRWAHFLANRDPARYDELAQFDPGIHNAMTTLKTLSQDEKTRLLAQAREEYTRLHYEDLRASMSEGIEKGQKEGHKKGHKEGHKKGRHEGETISLLRLLENRFGDIPQEAEDRIKTASLERIREWFDLAINAESLDAVFARKPL